MTVEFFLSSLAKYFLIWIFSLSRWLSFFHLKDSTVVLRTLKSFLSIYVHLANKAVLIVNSSKFRCVLLQATGVCLFFYIGFGQFGALMLFRFAGVLDPTQIQTLDKGAELGDCRSLGLVVFRDAELMSVSFSCSFSHVW